MDLVNEKVITSENTFYKEEFKFNKFLQVVLTAVNGITLEKSKMAAQGADILDQEDNLIQTRNEIPIANIYFKFHHPDRSKIGMGHKNRKEISEDKFLTNKYQDMVVEELHSKIDKNILAW